ncbi:hypothetical protein [Microbacterium sp. S308A+]|uniref:hypothetical protein n=1 Tax=Microbacterium sp. S308A+ TaxID=3415135 RepID=UPI003C7B40AD
MPDSASDPVPGGAPRQRVVRVGGSRRARLTPAPGTRAEPHERDPGEGPSAGKGGPNDDRMRREVPPHY